MVSWFEMAPMQILFTDVGETPVSDDIREYLAKVEEYCVGLAV